MADAKPLLINDAFLMVNEGKLLLVLPNTSLGTLCASLDLKFAQGFGDALLRSSDQLLSQVKS